MKLSALSTLIAALSSLAALTTALECDFSAIEAQLFPNATGASGGIAQCAAETGVDIFDISDYPSEQQVEEVFQNRGCVEYLNQVAERANSEIQCEIQVGNQSVSFAGLLTDFLTGHTGNETASASASGSDIEFPDSASGSTSESGLVKESSSSVSGSESTAKDSSASSTAARSSSTLSLAIAGAAIALSFVA